MALARDRSVRLTFFVETLQNQNVIQLQTMILSRTSLVSIPCTLAVPPPPPPPRNWFVILFLKYNSACVFGVPRGLWLDMCTAAVVCSTMQGQSQGRCCYPSSAGCHLGVWLACRQRKYNHLPLLVCHLQLLPGEPGLACDPMLGLLAASVV